MNIRPAQLNDVYAMSSLARLLSKKYITGDFSAEAAKLFLDSLTPETLINNMATDISYLVAEKEGTVIGFVGIKDFYHLFHLFVAEAFQRQGIARKLWQAVMTECLLSGNDGEFTVNSSLYAQPLYEKLGFVAESGPQEKNKILTIPMKLSVTELKKSNNLSTVFQE